MTMPTVDDINVVGKSDATIIVVCDPPTDDVYNSGKVMSTLHMNTFAGIAKKAGFSGSDFAMVTASPPIPESSSSSESKINAFVMQYRQSVLEVLQQFQNKRAVVYLGKTAGRVVEGGAVKITKARGKPSKRTIDGCMIFPTLSPANVLARPETEEFVQQDLDLLHTLYEYDFSWDAYQASKDNWDLRWVDDPSELLAILEQDAPESIAFDTETTGLDIFKDAPFVVQLCWDERKAISVPVSEEYWEGLDKEGILTVLRDLFADEEVNFVAHNVKYDLHMLKNIGIDVANVWGDTMQLCAVVDENMKGKSLAECVRRWDDELSGYSDVFDSTINKSNMMAVPKDQMLEYSAKDALATFRLAKRLARLAREDQKNYRLFELIQMPAIRVFFEMERRGIQIDYNELKSFEQYLDELERSLYSQMIDLVPEAVLRKHRESGLSFNSQPFVIDILFSKDGFGLEPIFFTKATSKEKKKDRVPTTGKEHLAFFTNVPFVNLLLEYKKVLKMRSTYVGSDARYEAKQIRLLKDGSLPTAIVRQMEAHGYDQLTDTVNGVRVRGKDRVLGSGTEQISYSKVYPITGGGIYVGESGAYKITQKKPSGFYQYLTDEGSIHPKYYLNRTVTLRTASNDPNGQNIPKRGNLAKRYRKCFVAREGYRLIQCDLSQAEIRIASWMAMEPTMLRIYNEGGDIHAMTASTVIGVSYDQFMEAKGSDKELPSNLRTNELQTYGQFFNQKRYEAKAVNFGFLYGMGWKKFKDYAKTDYGIDLTEEEAIHFREVFFKTYPALVEWHQRTRHFVRKNGYVRALHGGIRRLPSITSPDDIIRGDCERQAINSPVQRFASDIALCGMCKFSELRSQEAIDGGYAFPVQFIHDAVDLEARIDKVMETASGLKWCMENVDYEGMFGITPPIPISADIEIGDNTADMEEVQVEAIKPEWMK